jgi:hypothetical protein
VMSKWKYAFTQDRKSHSLRIGLDPTSQRRLSIVRAQKKRWSTSNGIDIICIVGALEMSIWKTHFC